MPISPTAEGFRAAFRRPSLTLGEIAWRWVTGATTAAVIFFGVFEYLNTLPVTNGELLFLRTRNPYFVSQAIAHIFRGSLTRAAMAALLAAGMLGLLWIVAASVGRTATVRFLLDYFRRSTGADGAIVAADQSRPISSHPFPSLVRLNFLRAAVALAAVVSFFGVAILADFASPDSNPHPGIAFLLFLPLAALVCLAWSVLNWLLSLAGMFAVRDGADTMSAISLAVGFCRERAGSVFAVSTWTGLAHIAAFVAASTAISMPLGFAGLLPWRLIVLVMLMATIAYFAVADWLYMARLAGYVCIAETPEALLKPLPPSPLMPIYPPAVSPVAPAPVQTTIDRDELILSDTDRSSDIDPDQIG
jgi:hypothetical protein